MIHSPSILSAPATHTHCPQWKRIIGACTSYLLTLCTCSFLFVNSSLIIISLYSKMLAKSINQFFLFYYYKALVHTQPSIVLLPGIHDTTMYIYWLQDNEETLKICIIFVSIMYCLLYKQVQSATAIVTDTLCLTQQKGQWPQVKMVQKNARLALEKSGISYFAYKEIP